MDISEYNDRRVRDLAWTLGSPPLLQRRDGHVRWVESAWFEDVLKDFEGDLLSLDKNPGRLHQVIDSRRDSRLGHYFESLWRYWLENNPRYQLLHANLQVQDGSRTIGEFDFIVRDDVTGKTLHWEIALKFYLGCGNTSLAANWWGPMRRDRLDIKTDRLIEHQTRLSKQPATRALLADLGISIDETWVILKGRLFYPLDGKQDSPAEHDPQHLRGFWLTASDFNRLDSTASWRLLDKPRWLAPLHNPETPNLATRELEDWWRLTDPLGPVCIASIRNDRETSRGFIVPDLWTQESS